MPQLPDYTALGERPTPQASPGIAEYQPPNWRQVGMAGQTVSSAGRDMEEASNTVAAASDAQDQKTALAAANQLQATRLKLEQDPANGFLNVKGNGVIGPDFVNGYQGKFKDAMSEIQDTLTNENQKRLFGQHAEVMGLQYQSALLQHQAKQTTLFNATTREDTVNLGLNDIAAHPYDDATYQTNQLAMGQTVVQAGKDMGLSGDALANFVRVGTTKLESKGLFYRTSGMLLDNPMKAADFYHQHELEFDPQDRMHLADGIKTAVDAQTARVGGQQSFQSAIGTANASPVPQNMGADKVAPYTAQRIDQVINQVKAPSQYDADINKWAQAYNVSPTELKLRMVAESGGNKDAVSSQGAIGLMQFMPETAKALQIDPRDPQQSIIGAAILMAKAGGTVGGDMSKVDRAYYGGNPAAKGPNTDQYVENLRAIRQHLYGTAPPPLTQDYLEGREGAVIDQAKADAEVSRPGDAVYSERMQAEAHKNWTNALAAVRGKNQQTTSSILGLFQGDNQPQALSDLPPALQQQFSQLPGQTQAAISAKFVRGSKADKLTLDDPEVAQTYYGLAGIAGNDPERFANMDLMPYVGKLPPSAWAGFVNQQKSINSKDVAQQARGANITQAHSTVDDMLKPIGLGKSAKANSANAKTTEQFYGRLDEALQTYRDQNGKWPQQSDVRQIAGSLLLQGKQAGGTLWDSTKRTFEVDDPSKFYVPLPGGSAQTQLATSFRKVMGHDATPSELQQWYTKYKLAGGK